MKQTEPSRSKGAAAAGFSCIAEKSGSTLSALAVVALDGCKKRTPCPCVHEGRAGSERTVPLVWSWMESSLAKLEAGRNTHSLHCCQANEVRGQNVFKRIHEQIPSMILSHHDSYVTFCILPTAEVLHASVTRWTFHDHFVSLLSGFWKCFWKSDWQETSSEFRCQTVICYDLSEIVGLALTVQNQCKASLHAMQRKYLRWW